MAYICGVDPGRDGAVAWVDTESGKLLGWADAESDDPATNARLYELFLGAEAVVIEHMVSFGGNSKTLLVLTVAEGEALGLAKLAGVTEIHRPTARAWKKALGVSSVKSTSKALTAELFDMPNRPRHDYHEAALLAWYGLQQKRSRQAQGAGHGA